MSPTDKSQTATGQQSIAPNTIFETKMSNIAISRHSAPK